MGLTAEDLGDVNRLAELAAGAKSGRSDLYMSVVQLYQLQAAQLSERERALMRDILKRLTLDVEMAIRIALAEQMADDPEAPLDLILLLADDAIEVARPIILRSRKLTDQDILDFLANADIARQTACAERADIGEAVTDRLAKSDAEPVLVALVRNATARIGAAAFEVLVDKSRRIAALQEPLAYRLDLPLPLATRMCVWASDALKGYLVTNHGIDPATIAKAVDQAARSVTQPPKADTGDAIQKLVEKLSVAGQLKPGFLVRVLQQGQTDLFDTAFAKLLGIDLGFFREFFYRKGPRPVALACRAVGIDRCVFPTVYTVSRQSRSINAVLSNEDRSEIDAVFAAYTRVEAFEILKRYPQG